MLSEMPTWHLSTPRQGHRPHLPRLVHVFPCIGMCDARANLVFACPRLSSRVASIHIARSRAISKPMEKLHGMGRKWAEGNHLCGIYRYATVALRENSNNHFPS